MNNSRHEEDAGEAACRYQILGSCRNSNKSKRVRPERIIETPMPVQHQQDQSTITMIGVGINTICSVMKYLRTT